MLAVSKQGSFFIFKKKENKMIERKRVNKITKDDSMREKINDRREKKAADKIGETGNYVRARAWAFDERMERIREAAREKERCACRGERREAGN